MGPPSPMFWRRVTIAAQILGSLEAATVGRVLPATEIGRGPRSRASTFPDDRLISQHNFAAISLAERHSRAPVKSPPRLGRHAKSTEILSLATGFQSFTTEMQQRRPTMRAAPSSGTPVASLSMRSYRAANVFGRVPASSLEAVVPKNSARAELGMTNPRNRIQTPAAGNAGTRRRQGARGSCPSRN
jgi:hypothetical protein